MVSDRRASLDDATEVVPELRRIVKGEFERGATLPLVCFPSDGDAVADSPRLTLVVVDPAQEWHHGEDDLAERIGAWTAHRSKTPRLHPFCAGVVHQEARARSQGPRGVAARMEASVPRTRPGHPRRRGRASRQH